MLVQQPPNRPGIAIAVVTLTPGNSFVLSSNPKESRLVCIGGATVAAIDDGEAIDLGHGDVLTVPPRTAVSLSAPDSAQIMVLA